MMVFQSGQEYHICGNMEGFEYIVNKDSTTKYKSELAQIQQSTLNTEIFEDYIIPEDVTVLDCRIKKSYRINAKYLVMDWNGGFSIINKRSTKKYLKELEAINRGIF